MAPRALRPNLNGDGDDKVTATGREITRMDRYARRKHFERLCSLRDAYAQRGDDDHLSVIDIDTVIAWASDLLARDGIAFIEQPTDPTTSDR